ncbi:MAG: hypothetical protein V1658_03540 [Candidatus Micrarchaeota archaeon]
MGKWMQIGTVVLILVFVIEIVAYLFTSNPYQQDGAITPTPVPTLSTEIFEGINVSDAYIVGVGKELLIICNTTQDVGPTIYNVSGVSAVSFDPSNDRVGVDVRQNASTEDVGREIKAELSAFCTPHIFKRAFIKLQDVLNFTDQQGGSKLISGSSLQCLQQPQTYIPCYAFVQLGTEENIATSFATFLRLKGDMIDFATSEEQQVSQPFRFNAATATGRVAGLLDEASASVSIPWEERLKYDAGNMALYLNSTVNASTVEFSIEDTIVLNTSSNETLEKAGNLSFVLSSIPSESTIVLQVGKNFTDEVSAVEGLQGIGVPESEIIFPESTITFGFIYFEGSHPIISEYFLPYEAEFARNVLVELDDPAAVEEGMGAAPIENSYEVFALNATLNSSINIIVNAILQGEDVVNSQAFEDR